MNGLVDPNNPQQIIVRKSATITLLGVALRQIGLIGGSFVTLYNLLSNKDFKGFMDYVASSEFFLVVGILITLGVAGWGYIRGYISHMQKVVMAKLVPDEIAVVVDKTTTTPPTSQ